MEELLRQYRKGNPCNEEPPLEKCELNLSIPVTKENVTLGLRVTRGPDWDFGNQDGGPGFVGTIITYQAPEFWVVNWDSKPKIKYPYRVGFGGKHDLAIAQSRHKIVVVPNLMLPGVVVTRGPSWIWGEQGGKDARGIIVEPSGDSKACVMWQNNSDFNYYRCGNNGKYDLAVIDLPDPQDPQLVGQYHARPGLPVFRGPEWNEGDKNGGQDGQGFLLEKVDKLWKVFWIETNIITKCFVGHRDSYDLLYYPGIHPRGQYSANRFHPIVNASNAYTGAHVLPGLHWESEKFPDSHYEGIIVSVNQINQTCEVQWITGNREMYNIGKNDKFELVFSKKLPLKLETFNRDVSQSLAIPGLRVTRGIGYDPRAWKDQDGGIGMEGVILRLSGMDGWAAVAWDNKNQYRYRFNDHWDLSMAFIGKYALRSFHPSYLKPGTRVFRGPKWIPTGRPTIEEGGVITDVRHDYKQNFRVEWESGFTTIHLLQEFNNDELVVGTEVKFKYSITDMLNRIQSAAKTLNPSMVKSSMIYSVVRPKEHPQTSDDDSSSHLSYEIMGCIGCGLTAKMFSAKRTNDDVAIKIIPEETISIDPTIPALVDTEIQNALNLKHQNIIAYYGIQRTRNGIEIVLEYAEKRSLKDYIFFNKGKIPPENKFDMAKGIINGLMYLHECPLKLTLGNLKSTNILIDQKGTIKITDYFYSMIEYRCRLTKKIPPLLHYLSPEYISRGEMTPKSDIYSFGIVMWELEAEDVPYLEWRGSNPKEFVRQVSYGSMRPQLSESVPLGQGFRNLYVQCWSGNQDSRPTPPAILEELKRLEQNFPR